MRENGQIITIDEHLTPEQLARFKELWERQFRGRPTKESILIGHWDTAESLEEALKNMVDEPL